jgi:hypothetical protein
MKRLLLIISVALGFSALGADDHDPARAHWAYQPVKKPAVPAVKNAAWVRTPIDAFILAQLEAKGMQPSPPATREALLRRVTFDLIGLPPTTEERRAFLADTSPNAFAKVVERLLASPHFGECWGRHWLDTARYADTAGQVKAIVESYRYAGAWAYRDYVINAFNEDKPYDQFIVEQIAADKLPRSNDATTLAALGFLTVGERFQNKNDIINDRIDAVTKGFLGLTVTCARCHDHKFDPIPTEDYYALHGIFSSSVEPVERPLITMVKDQTLVADYQAKLRALEEKDRELYFDAVERINGAFRKKIAETLMATGAGGGGGRGGMQPPTTMAPARGGPPPDQNATPAPGSSGRGMRTQGRTNGQPSPTPQPEPNATPAPGRTGRGAQAQGRPTGTPQPGQNTTPAPGRAGRGMQPQPATTNATPSPRQPAQSMTPPPARGGGGGTMAGRGGAIGDDKIGGAALQNVRADDAVWGPWLRFRQLAPGDFATRGKALASEIAGGKWNVIIAAQFKDTAPASLADVAAIYAAAFARADAEAKKYLAAKRSATNGQAAGFDSALAELIEKPLRVLPGGSLTTERLRDEIAQWPRGLRTAAPFAFEEINALDISHPAAPAHAMVMEDSPTPADSPVFIRGQAEVRGAVVPRRFLEVLGGPNRPTFTAGSGRLELARAIASKSNPLTARVLVNRVWMHLFGQGFVPTPDDLGVQSEKPSHPELLDWLASAFMESGWSQKKLIRIIVLSNVYQESSDENPPYAALDSNDRLLWRANIRRLDFEAIRDSLLVFSGKLDATLGGKLINLTEEPYSFRRSVYGYVDRGNLPEVMQQFDFSDPDMPNSKRATSIVPQQALYFMNSPMVVDVARKMVARKEFTEAKDDGSRIAALYDIIFQRTPRFEETKIGLAYVEKLQRKISASPAAGPSPEPKRRGGAGPENGRTAVQNQGERVERRPSTAWEQYAQALMFTNELVYVN